MVDVVDDVVVKAVVLGLVENATDAGKGCFGGAGRPNDNW